MLVKVQNNKIYNANRDSVYLKNLNVRNIEVAKNDILKNLGSGVHLFNIKTNANDPKRVSIRNNFITEIS
jgi:hypothetical protein